MSWTKVNRPRIPRWLKGQVMRPNPWYWEGNIQGAIVEYLRKADWRISRSADTTSREAGKDIEAERGSRELWVTVKGWPEKSANTQARHWFAAALFDLVLYRTDNPSVELAIGIPGGIQHIRKFAAAYPMDA